MVDPKPFFAASGLLIVAGKGGVGKTTVTAATAIAAAGLGLRVLVVELDDGGPLGPLLGAGSPLGYEPTVLAERLDGRLIVPADALRDYLRDHGLGRLTERLVRGGVIDVVATAAPGIDDILVLGKVKQLERSGMYDLMVLDAPAAGHAISFLRSARGLADAVRTGPVLAQARDVLELLGDASRCRVLLVAMPEETPVNETVESARALKDDIGVHLGPIVVNGLYPELDLAVSAGGRSQRALADAARFRLARQQQQRDQIERLQHALPLPHVRLPFVFTAGLGPSDARSLAEVLVDQVQALPS
jgi:anion-transporting  ArsA/GET3 family ATPase